jgi:hypothetical protein
VSVSEASTGHESAGALAVVGMKDALQLVEIDIIETVCDNMDVYRNFFQNGLKYLNEKVPQMYEYGRFVEEERDSFNYVKEEQRKTVLLSRKETRATRLVTFGVDLTILCRRESNLVPNILEVTIKLLEERNAISEEGIFRISGVKPEIDTLKETIDDTNNPQVIAEMDQSWNPNNVASLLKLWLRTLPEPLIPFSKYQSMIAAASLRYY